MRIKANNPLKKEFNNAQKKIDSPEDAVEIAKDLITDWKKEHLIVLFVDSRGRCMGAEVVGIGTISQTITHPREIFSPAIVARATGVVVLHNHPTGDLKPSQQDINTTYTLEKGAELLRLNFLDHIIFIMNGDWFSIKNSSN